MGFLPRESGDSVDAACAQVGLGTTAAATATTTTTSAGESATMSQSQRFQAGFEALLRDLAADELRAVCPEGNGAEANYIGCGVAAPASSSTADVADLRFLSGLEQDLVCRADA